MSLNGIEKQFEEWEKVRCPICMEHPHQAILLLCSSHQVGCRPYICDTASHHSHCFTKLRATKKLVCPLCHGKVKDWRVDIRAQHFMNRKPHTCAHEACEFSGTYLDLEHHVKLVHPSAAGPSGAGPVTQEDLMDLQYCVNQLDMSRRG